MTTKHTPGRRKGSYSQASRVLAILDVVRREGAPVPLARVAAQFGLSERQARRDVAMLAEAGVRMTLVDGRSAVECDDGDEGVRLTPRERMLLASLAPLAAQLGPGALGDELREALAKLALPPRLAEGTPITLAGGPAPLASPSTAEKIDRIERAIRERLELRVRTTAERDDARLLTFLPYLLVLHAGGVYVAGRWEPGEPIRAVHVERLAHVELALGTSVAAPQSIDVARLFEAARAAQSPRVAMT